MDMRDPGSCNYSPVSLHYILQTLLCSLSFKLCFMGDRLLDSGGKKHILELGKVSGRD